MKRIDPTYTSYYRYTWRALSRIKCTPYTILFDEYCPAAVHNIYDDVAECTRICVLLLLYDTSDRKIYCPTTIADNRNRARGDAKYSTCINIRLLFFFPLFLLLFGRRRFSSRSSDTVAARRAYIIITQ